jgi:hypothetical protein
MYSVRLEGLYAMLEYTPEYVPQNISHFIQRLKETYNEIGRSSKLQTSCRASSRFWLINN